jgi:hypothetical protein
MKFYKEVETYFLETRGRLFGMSSYNLVSPKEIQGIRKWEISGIPLKVIKEAIEESLRRFLDNYPHRRDDPPSLLYCQPTVLKKWKEYKEASIGGRVRKETGKPSAESIAGLIKQNIKILENSKSGLIYIANEPGLKKIISVIDEQKLILAKLDTVSAAKELSSALLTEYIDTAKMKIMAAIFKNLSFEKSRVILKSIKNEMREYIYKMTREAYRDTRNIIFEDKILEITGLSKIQTLK